MDHASKPSYGTSKRYLWGSFWASWGLLYLIVFGALFGSNDLSSIAPVAFPALVALIAGMLGVHRHYGSKDFEATCSDRFPPPPPYPSGDVPDFSERPSP
ncbi:hypothetical protein BG46_01360 [Brucella anthropi]|uniref:NAD(P)+ transhydrogenase beta chain n=1 Tax=Brucella anthropi TaxID=529 RepID=UPI00044D1E14|nr:NAD(P)+ transhydrogenase beta chain [Brucella anthropi]EXL08204.1 hypothetical protein BG46_01360 [Brucella anthropi]